LNAAIAAAVADLKLHALRLAARLAPRQFEKRLLAHGALAAESFPTAPGREFARQLLHAGPTILAKAGPRCRAKLLDNLLVSTLRGDRERTAYARRTGLAPPFLLVVSPTTRCNLACTGCYATNPSRDDDMPAELLDRLLGEARAMGIYFITISGGEPLARPDLLDILARHPRMYFQVFTNGTLIDARAADRLAALGHVFPVLSVEGFEAETDARRGSGTFAKITAAMDRLRERGVLFGFSATATRETSDLVVSDEFVDFYAEKGCVAGWWFSLMPVGAAATALDRMPTPEQRLHRRRRLTELRRRLPMVLLDFLNDEALVGGCMAGGRYLAHINVRGDVEPCVFCQFAVDNLREKSLHEVLDSAYFRQIRARQPYSPNPLRGCMVTDHPQVLRDLVGAAGVRPTCAGGDGLLCSAAAGLDRYAAEWGRLADAEWAAEGSDGGDCDGRTNLV
jgi:MoaA/NifB/PqqE/SkfB family radical SAM enzyme